MDNGSEDAGWRDDLEDKKVIGGDGLSQMGLGRSEDLVVFVGRENWRV